MWCNLKVQFNAQRHFISYTPPPPHPISSSPQPHLPLPPDHPHDQETLLTEKDRFDEDLDKDADGHLSEVEIRQWLVPDSADTATSEVGGGGVGVGMVLLGFYVSNFINIYMLIYLAIYICIRVVLIFTSMKCFVLQRKPYLFTDRNQRVKFESISLIFRGSSRIRKKLFFPQKLVFLLIFNIHKENMF